jgi:CheY-like chemotaxis protein
MDGYGASRAIRAQESASGLARVPIVAVTASAVEDVRDACTAAGMDQVIEKPLKADEVAAVVTRWLPQVSRRDSS